MTCEHEWTVPEWTDATCARCGQAGKVQTGSALTDLARVTAERDEARAVVEAARTLDDACDDAFSSTALACALGGIRRALDAYDAGRAKP